MTAAANKPAQAIKGVEKGTFVLRKGTCVTGSFKLAVKEAAVKKADKKSAATKETKAGEKKTAAKKPVAEKKAKAVVAKKQPRKLVR